VSGPQGRSRPPDSVATRCRVCALFHTESAKLFGATYINGIQVDYDEFKAQVDRVVDHVKATAAA
jgi:hypothetical protein